MSKSVSASSSENSPPTSFEQFNELVKGIESLYVLGRRLSDASLGNLARLPTAWVHHRPSEIISVIGLSGSMRHQAVQPHWKPPRILRAMSAVYGAESLSLVLPPQAMSCIN